MVGHPVCTEPLTVTIQCNHWWTQIDTDEKSHSETCFPTPGISSPSSDQKHGEPKPGLCLQNLCLSAFICGFPLHPAGPVLACIICSAFPAVVRMITLPSFPRLIPSVRRQFEAARSYSESLRSWSGQATADVQLRKLQGVWSDCISDVPYYRNLVNRGKAPDEINSWDDFRKLPALDRPTLKENASAFIRDSGPPDGTVSTAGSTGQPVKLGTWRHEGRSEERRVGEEG